eukprot:881001-Prorocentrum_minimum.AAC.1
MSKSWKPPIAYVDSRVEDADARSKLRGAREAESNTKARAAEIDKKKAAWREEQRLKHSAEAAAAKSIRKKGPAKKGVDLKAALDAQRAEAAAEAEAEAKAARIQACQAELAKPKKDAKGGQVARQIQDPFAPVTQEVSEADLELKLRVAPATKMLQIFPKGQQKRDRGRSLAYSPTRAERIANPGVTVPDKAEPRPGPEPEEDPFWPKFCRQTNEEIAADAAEEAAARRRQREGFANYRYRRGCNYSPPPEIRRKKSASLTTASPEKAVKAGQTPQRRDSQ